MPFLKIVALYRKLDAKALYTKYLDSTSTYKFIYLRVILIKTILKQ